jgi:phosphate uptake regulator
MYTYVYITIILSKRRYLEKSLNECWDKDEMKRKIVQHGPSTLTISLPSKWVKTFGITKGDEVNVEMTKNGLLITAGKEKHHGQKRINVKGLSAVITRSIAALYKAGYDEIIVEYSTPEELEHIHSTVSTSYIGFEIVEETKTQVTVRKVSEPTNEEFRTIFRRIFHFLLSTAEESYDAATKDDKSAYQRLILRDKHINKLSNFCRRVVNKRGQTEYAQETAIYHIIEQLEKIGDNYKELNKHLSAAKASKRSLVLYAKVNAMLRDYEDLFFSFSLAKMNRFIMNYKEFFGEIKKDTDDPVIAYHLQSIVHELFNLSGATMILHL